MPLLLHAPPDSTAVGGGAVLIRWVVCISSVKCGVYFVCFGALHNRKNACVFWPERAFLLLCDQINRTRLTRSHR